MEIYITNKKDGVYYCYAEGDTDIEKELGTLDAYELGYLKSVVDRLAAKREAE